MPRGERGACGRHRAVAVCGLLGLAISGCMPVPARAGRNVSECRDIADDRERLECYDRASRPESGVAEWPGGPGERLPENAVKESFLSQIWELDEDTRKGKYALKLHRSSYALPFTFNASPNEAAAGRAGPSADLMKPEVAFQMSVKAKLWQDIRSRPADLWICYTQRSFWQMYDFDNSSPFRETNYEPEILLNFRTGYRVLGLEGRFVSFGLNHQSNGQAEPLSRSWNRLVMNFGFERGPLSLVLKTWYRLPETDDDDDNPGIEKYLGYGELWAYYFHGRHRFGVMVRDNLDFDSNRGAVQLEWVFPLIFDNIGGYVQYFGGYGESLLDYDHKVNRVGFGFVLLD